MQNNSLKVFIFSLSTGGIFRNTVVIDENIVEAALKLVTYKFRSNFGKEIDENNIFSMCIENDIVEINFYVGETFLSFNYKVLLNYLEVKKGSLHDFSLEDFED